MAAPKTCGFCLEPLTDCCCDDEPARETRPGTATASGLTLLHARAEGGDDPSEPDPELYHIES